ncbi:hypothetical protein HYH03_004423 [Edaphochlamys debaryana]|uniref:UBC core domain-containing protein n=1 Tax=Edaphochlamys debaryana TaxID=47281 RepID=A0A835Y7X4_9CHLO|nr:hypothetical protein HYH03_004423 [Edaphochlamys debaryana]|eukprot:KAG2497686.1 hypothetical protein HYH03_004423 [Edaphochlamys debaryana]
MAEAPRFNLRNPAVKRIMQEIKEIKQDTSGDLLAEALETDIFEWHFVIRGPRDTEFEGGIYHGRILLPAEYPFKPPSFMMLSPNGRFETQVKICLSISSHHPEHWQPSWSVRTALTALIAFMPSPGAGALGAIDFSKEERRVLAARSRAEPPRFGSAERQRVIEDMHARMLAMEAAQPGPSGSGSGSQQAGPGPQAEPVAAPAPAPAAEAAPASAPSPSADQPAEAQPSPAPAPAPASPAPASAAASAASPAPPAAAAAASPATKPAAAPAPTPTRAAPQPQLRPAQLQPQQQQEAAAAAAAAAAVVGTTGTDHVLTALMWALYVGIGAILLRKVMGVMGVELGDLAEMLQ